MITEEMVDAMRILRQFMKSVARKEAVDSVIDMLSEFDPYEFDSMSVDERKLWCEQFAEPLYGNR